MLEILEYFHYTIRTSENVPMAVAKQIQRTVLWNGQNVPIYPMETISFERLLSQEPAEIEKTVRCCETEGFFYLDLKGIDGRRYLEDQEKTLELMHRFFEAPSDAKNQFGLVSPHLGYVIHEFITKSIAEC